MTTLRSLRRHRGDDQPGIAPERVPAWQTQDAEEDDGTPPVVYEQMPSFGAQLRVLVVHALAASSRTIRDQIAQDGGLVNAGFLFQPPSVAQQIEYAHNRSWVKPGYEGCLLDRMGTRYQRRHGIPGVAAAAFISWVFKRGWRALWAGVISTVATVAVLCGLFPHERLWFVLGAAVLWALELISLIV
jgi:hypothetical protein